MNLVVTYATGRFIVGRNRLVDSCRKLGQSIVCYDNEAGFTRHSDFPYYFKVDALLAASKHAEVLKQAKILIWADASVFATGKGSLTPIFEYIEREGYWLQKNGCNNAEWCNDASLDGFSFTRKEASNQCQVDAACYGIAPDHPTGKLILDELVSHQKLFKGAWTNDQRTESLDHRCQGHRHDQSVLSLIAAKHQLNILGSEEHRWYRWGINPDYLLNLDHV